MTKLTLVLLFLFLLSTVAIPMRVDARMEVVKKRAEELKGFLDLIQEGGE